MSGADPAWQFILGGLIFAALIAVNIAKPKVGYKLVSVLSVTGIIATLVGVTQILDFARSVPLVIVCILMAQKTMRRLGQ